MWFPIKTPNMQIPRGHRPDLSVFHWIEFQPLSKYHEKIKCIYFWQHEAIWSLVSSATKHYKEINNSSETRGLCFF